MKKYNPENERIKRSYFTFLKEAKRHSEPTIDAAAKALHRFENYTGHRDFKAFHFQQAVAFKKHLAGQQAEKSGKPLSKATLHSTMSQLKRFFQWLALQPGYKSRLQYANETMPSQHLASFHLRCSCTLCRVFRSNAENGL